MTELYTRHVDLYDLAFAWDITEEADWLLERLGPTCRRVLEPGCGTGRVLEALARRGIDAVGIDNSPQMTSFAERRLRDARLAARVVLADMRRFDLGETFDGAVCPINTLAHLTRDEVAAHLECVARHLRPGASYLVQLALRDPDAPTDLLRPSSWEISKAGTRLRITWATEDVDFADGFERQRSRIEIVGGDRSGEIIEEVHVVTMWTRERWLAAVAASPFALTATYDGEEPGRPQVAQGGTGRLLWHQLARKLEH
jgi:SAM-dependent methyltransferase